MCGAEWNCVDYLDDDGDGLVDCDDMDCFRQVGCGSRTFTFTDTEADDLAGPEIEAFFLGVPVVDSDYLYFGVFGPGANTEICTERADFYRDSYLSLAVAGGTVVSGPWDKWVREEGGAWSGPDSTGYTNAFGFFCFGDYSWCPEQWLATEPAGVGPMALDPCELFDSMSCSDGTWVLTLRIGVDRLSACGF